MFKKILIENLICSASVGVYEKEKLNLAHSYELKQNKIELESQIKTT